MLEDNIDEKYYVDDDLLQHIIATKKEHENYTQYNRYNGWFEQLCRVWKDIAPTLHLKSNYIELYDKQNNIRRLTPKECWRLMGFDDEDYEKASKVNSNAQLYKQAGNSIVVNVLEAILKEVIS